ncbi:MAG TPA: sigma-54 dependent transcriptional regulator [Candidatus Dormibacteraeota bacterium]|nr:sigma-54 dependent transcriptional regulator [Candidatus Dormibacteraeota bacterium]
MDRATERSRENESDTISDRLTLDNASEQAARARVSFGETGGLVGTSVKMQELYALVGKISQHSYPVLILGESGTGKELVARSIHDLGPRRAKLFVPVDCSAIVPTLIESELFGHVKGAFTGADRTTQGLFEVADGGTLFLDEIAEIPVDLQPKLLRVLQEKEIRRIGSTERIPINVRVTAATNRDLEAGVRGGTFRQDLYFRLNVMQIKLPPLRERKSDLPLLVNHFLQKFYNAGGLAHTISEDVMRQLMGYDWPGNVRELENAIECAAALSPDAVLHVADLPPKIRSGECLADDHNELVTLEETVRRALLRALRDSDGHKLVAARRLGIGKTTLYRKLKQYARNKR